MMSNFEYLKSLGLSGLAEWLDRYGQFDNSPWVTWFTKNYCDKCESIKCCPTVAREKLGIESFSTDGTVECSYCELEGKCRFFPDLEPPDSYEILKMWLCADRD